MTNSGRWIALSLLLAAPHGPASAGDAGAGVPIAMQGTWGKSGRCDVAADRLTITPDTAALGEGSAEKIHYSGADRSIHWDEEYQVDNFTFGGNRDILVHNLEGNGMSAREGYARCGAGLARVAWPPKD